MSCSKSVARRRGCAAVGRSESGNFLPSCRTMRTDGDRSFSRTRVSIYFPHPPCPVVRVGGVRRGRVRSQAIRLTPSRKLGRVTGASRSEGAGRRGIAKNVGTPVSSETLPAVPAASTAEVRYDRKTSTFAISRIYHTASIVSGWPTRHFFFPRPCRRYKRKSLPASRPPLLLARCVYRAIR